MLRDTIQLLKESRWYRREMAKFHAWFGLGLLIAAGNAFYLHSLFAPLHTAVPPWMGSVILLGLVALVYVFASRALKRVQDVRHTLDTKADAVCFGCGYPLPKLTDAERKKPELSPCAECGERRQPRI